MSVPCAQRKSNKNKNKDVEILLHIAGVECRGLDATTTEVGGHFLMDQEPQFFSLREQRASCIQKYSSRPCTTATIRTRRIRHRGIPHGARIPPTFPVVFAAADAVVPSAVSATRGGAIVRACGVLARRHRPRQTAVPRASVAAISAAGLRLIFTRKGPER